MEQRAETGLGLLAVTMGYCTAAQVEQAESALTAVPDRDLGEVLVGMGVLSPRQLAVIRDIVDEGRAPDE